MWEEREGKWEGEGRGWGRVCLEDTWLFQWGHHRASLMEGAFLPYPLLSFSHQIFIEWSQICGPRGRLAWASQMSPAPFTEILGPGALMPLFLQSSGGQK